MKHLINWKKSFIEQAEKNLEGLYSITQEAETLQALIESQKKERLGYEIEMNELKIEWEKSKTEFIKEFEQQKEKKLLERGREEEEYKYNLKLSRQKDKDAYEIQKTALEQEIDARRSEMEKDFQEREKAISAHEEEYEQLKKKAESYPKEIEEMVTATKQETEESIRKELQFETQLEQQKMQGEVLLLKQDIESLKRKIQEQEKYISELSNKSHEAQLQVKEIACKVVEGTSIYDRFEHSQSKSDA